MFDRWKKIEVTVYRLRYMDAPILGAYAESYYFDNPIVASGNGNAVVTSKTLIISKRELDKIFNSQNSGYGNPVAYTAERIYSLAEDIEVAKERAHNIMINKGQYQKVISQFMSGLNKK